MSRILVALLFGLFGGYLVLFVVMTGLRCERSYQSADLRGAFFTHYWMQLKSAEENSQLSTVTSPMLDSFKQPHYSVSHQHQFSMLYVDQQRSIMHAVPDSKILRPQNREMLRLQGTYVHVLALQPIDAQPDPDVDRGQHIDSWRILERTVDLASGETMYLSSLLCGQEETGYLFDVDAYVVRLENQPAHLAVPCPQGMVETHFPHSPGGFCS